MTCVNFVAARLRAATLSHFSCLRRGLFSLIPVETTKVPTAGIDMDWRCYWNPEFFKSLNIDQAACVLVHELWHRLHRHGERARRLNVTRDTHDVWNWVIDASIHENSGVLIDTLRTIKDCQPCERRLSPVPLPENRSAETWYEILLKWRSSQPKLKITLGSGSGADGLKMEWELPSGSKTPVISKEQAENIIKTVANAIASGRGTVPEGWSRWAKETIVPQEDWTIRLQNIFGQMTAVSAAAHRWTFRRMSRREPRPGVLMPGWVGNTVSVAFLIDTSGSVRDEWLGLAARQLNLALARLASSGRSPSVNVYSCDAAVSTAKTIWNAATVALAGGGGTDMRVGMQQIEKDRAKHQYDMMVVITDGETPWPDVPPSLPTLIVLFDKAQKEASELPEWTLSPPHGSVTILS